MFFESLEEVRKITVERKSITLHQEPCDCYEKHGRVMHNNGGNYHAIERVHTFSDGEGNWCVVLERTDTREGFPMDEYDALLFSDERGWEMVTRWHDVIPPCEENNIVAEFRYGEAQIIAHSDAHSE